MLATAFFGTPELAVPSLTALVEAGYRPRLVVSRPPRPAGRGRRLQEPPVAVAARRLGLALTQPETVKSAAFLAEIGGLGLDLAVVVAFGQIFPRSLLELPRLGCVNLHASLLPRHRGAAPIPAAIAAGDERTGVTTMRMEEGLDSGPILLQEETEIAPEETAGELGARLAVLGARLLVRTVEELEAGTLTPRPQDGGRATYAPRLDKSAGVVDWRLPAAVIARRVRALTPWPGATAELAERPLKILRARPLPDTAPAGALPGTLGAPAGDTLPVVCGGGTILGLEQVQRPGKRPIAARDLTRGERLTPGARFTVAPPAAGTAE